MDVRPWPPSRYATGFSQTNLLRHFFDNLKTHFLGLCLVAISNPSTISYNYNQSYIISGAQQRIFVQHGPISIVYQQPRNKQGTTAIGGRCLLSQVQNNSVIGFAKILKVTVVVAGCRSRPMVGQLHTCIISLLSYQSVVQLLKFVDQLANIYTTAGL